MGLWNHLKNDQVYINGLSMLLSLFWQQKSDWTALFFRTALHICRKAFSGSAMRFIIAALFCCSPVSAKLHHLFIGGFSAPYIYAVGFDDETLALTLLHNSSWNRGTVSGRDKLPNRDEKVNVFSYSMACHLWYLPPRADPHGCACALSLSIRPKCYWHYTAQMKVQSRTGCHWAYSHR